MINLKVYCKHCGREIKQLKDSPNEYRHVETHRFGCKYTGSIMNKIAEIDLKRLRDDQLKILLND